MEPTCLNIIFIRVCVWNTCGFHKLLFFNFEYKSGKNENKTIHFTNK